jgi:hypothetical protein
MVKFRLPKRRLQVPAGGADRLPATPNPRQARFAAIVKILIKCRHFKFDEKQRQIRCDIDPKRRFISNDSFNPVC